MAFTLWMQELLAEWKRARNGACYTIGGDQEAWDIVEPIFRDTAVENGYLYAGKAGSGHFLKWFTTELNTV